MSNAMITDRYCAINGLNIRYWTKGNSKKSLVLIHGLGGSIEAWTKNIVHLSEHFTVYAVDLPGHGKSDKPKLRYTIGFLADFIGDFVEHLRIAPCHIGGLSFGGAVAIYFTLNNKDKVDKLVLISSAGLAPGVRPFLSLVSMAPVRSMMRFVPRWLFTAYVKSTVFDSNSLPPDITDFYFNLLKTNEFRRALLSMQREIFTFFGLSNRVILGLAAEINTINKKSLIIWGKNDTIIPLANAFRANKLIVNSKLVIFDRCSHNPQFEKASEFNDVVSEFLLNS